MANNLLMQISQRAIHKIIYLGVLLRKLFILLYNFSQFPNFNMLYPIIRW